MPLDIPKVPDGLEDLMKGLSKAVLKEKPENLVEFIANYLENLLIERDGSLMKNYEKFSYVEKSRRYNKQKKIVGVKKLKANKGKRNGTIWVEKTNNTKSAPQYIDAPKVEVPIIKTSLLAVTEESKSELGSDKSETHKENVFDVQTSNLVPDTKKFKNVMNMETAALIIQKCYKTFMFRKKQNAETLTPTETVVKEDSKSLAEYLQQEHNSNKSEKIEAKVADTIIEHLPNNEHNKIDMDKAALKIQKSFRGYRTRKELKSLRQNKTDTEDDKKILVDENHNVVNVGKNNLLIANISDDHDFVIDQKSSGVEIENNNENVRDVEPLQVDLTTKDSERNDSGKSLGDGSLEHGDNFNEVYNSSADLSQNDFKLRHKETQADNNRELNKNFKQDCSEPGKEIGMVAAAITIQKFFRGHQTRRNVKNKTNSARLSKQDEMEAIIEKPAFKQTDKSSELLLHANNKEYAENDIKTSQEESSLIQNTNLDPCNEANGNTESKTRDNVKHDEIDLKYSKPEIINHLEDVSLVETNDKLKDQFQAISHEVEMSKNVEELEFFDEALKMKHDEVKVKNESISFSTVKTEVNDIGNERKVEIVTDKSDQNMDNILVETNGKSTIQEIEELTLSSREVLTLRANNNDYQENETDRIEHIVLPLPLISDGLVLEKLVNEVHNDLPDLDDPEMENAALKIQKSFRNHKKLKGCSEEKEANVKIEGDCDTSTNMNENITDTVTVRELSADINDIIPNQNVSPNNPEEESENIILESSKLHHTKSDDDELPDLNDPEMENAALKIQKSFRGHSKRKENLSSKQKNEERNNEKINEQENYATPTNDATLINSSDNISNTMNNNPTMINSTKSKDDELPDLNDPEMENAALKIQKSFRGHSKRNENRISLHKYEELINNEVMNEQENDAAPSHDAILKNSNDKISNKINTNTTMIDTTKSNDDELPDLNDHEMENAALKIQKSFRGHTKRKENVNSKQTVKNEIENAQGNDDPNSDTILINGNGNMSNNMNNSKLAVDKVMSSKDNSNQTGSIETVEVGIGQSDVEIRNNNQLVENLVLNSQTNIEKLVEHESNDGNEFQVIPNTFMKDDKTESSATLTRLNDVNNFGSNNAPLIEVPTITALVTSVSVPNNKTTMEDDYNVTTNETMLTEQPIDDVTVKKKPDNKSEKLITHNLNNNNTESESSTTKSKSTIEILEHDLDSDEKQQIQQFNGFIESTSTELPDLNDPETTEAALKIQKSFRGHKVRNVEKANEIGLEKSKTMADSVGIDISGKGTHDMNINIITSADEKTEQSNEPVKQEFFDNAERSTTTNNHSELQENEYTEENNVTVGDIVNKEENSHNSILMDSKDSQPTDAVSRQSQEGKNQIQEKHSLSEDRKSQNLQVKLNKTEPVEENELPDLTDPEMADAALKIQKTFRGHKNRKFLKNQSLQKKETKDSSEKCLTEQNDEKLYNESENNQTKGNEQHMESFNNAYVTSKTEEIFDDIQNKESKQIINELEKIKIGLPLDNVNSELNNSKKQESSVERILDDNKLRFDYESNQNDVEKPAELDVSPTDQNLTDLHNAATKIQKTYRGYMVRKEVKEKNPKPSAPILPELQPTTDVDNLVQAPTASENISQIILSHAKDILTTQLEQSATTIQKHYRGYKERKAYKKLQHKMQKLVCGNNSVSEMSDSDISIFNSVVTIQKFFRGYRIRRDLKNKFNIRTSHFIDDESKLVDSLEPIPDGKQDDKIDVDSLDNFSINDDEHKPLNADIKEEPCVKKYHSKLTQLLRSSENSTSLSELDIETHPPIETDLKLSDSYIDKLEIKPLESLSRSTTAKVHDSLSQIATSQPNSLGISADEIKEIENVDITSFDKDSIEAMYYSLRKNEILLDKMHRVETQENTSPIDIPVIVNAITTSEERLQNPIQRVHDFKTPSTTCNSETDSDDIVLKQLTLDFHEISDNLSKLQTAQSSTDDDADVQIGKVALYYDNDKQVKEREPGDGASVTSDHHLDIPNQQIYSLDDEEPDFIRNSIETNESFSNDNPILFAQKRMEKFLNQIHEKDNVDNDGGESDRSDDQPDLINKIELDERSFLSDHAHIEIIEEDDVVEDMKSNYKLSPNKYLSTAISEADSDYFDTSKMQLIKDDFNISTALESYVSTDSESTYNSAATKIQAGARGFLTRRRVQSMNNNSVSEKPSSIGNAAIDQSLDDMVEENTLNQNNAKQKYQARNQSTLHGSTITSSDETEMYGITDVKLEQKSVFPSPNIDDEDENDSDYQPNNQFSYETLNESSFDSEGRMNYNFDEYDRAATRRLTLQRGNAVQRNSTPDEDDPKLKTDNPNNGFEIKNEKLSVYESPIRIVPQVDAHIRNKSSNSLPDLHNSQSIKRGLIRRQRTMPVQIETDLIRPVPKHMRKRIKSANNTTLTPSKTFSNSLHKNLN